jgi:hypothetical protein
MKTGWFSGLPQSLCSACHRRLSDCSTGKVIPNGRGGIGDNLMNRIPRLRGNLGLSVILPSPRPREEGYELRSAGASAG